MNVKLQPSQRKRIRHAKDIYPTMREILMRDNKIDRDKEHLWIICLSGDDRLLMIDLVSLGSVYRTTAEPMDIFSFALQKPTVKKIIMVHNHHDGSLEPSPADIAITEQMFAIGKFVRVPVIDHLIISAKDYYSFDDKGLMSRMEKENKYDLTFTEQKKLMAEMERISLEKKAAELERAEALRKLATAHKDKAKEIAKNLLAKGIDKEIVAESSGLSKEEIEQLIQGKA